MTDKQKAAFVLMPFSYPFRDYYENIYEPALNAADYHVSKADDIFASRPIMADIISSIQEADIILCEMSGRNPNVFYELGIAHSMQKKVILVSSVENDIPFDLRFIRVLLYETESSKWSEKLKLKITLAAQDLESDSKKDWSALFPNMELKGELTIEQAKDLIELYVDYIVAQLNIEAGRFRSQLKRYVKGRNQNAIDIFIEAKTYEVVKAARNRVARFRLAGGVGVTEFLEKESPLGGQHGVLFETIQKTKEAMRIEKLHDLTTEAIMHIWLRLVQKAQTDSVWWYREKLKQLYESK
jgi:hypothetical protein